TVALAGCATLQPALPAADAQLVEHWPMPEHGDAGSAPGAVADVGWGEVFNDPQLSRLIALALDNNRDLRVALLNVERARAQYRIQRADRLPSIGIGASLTRTGGDAGRSDVYAANLGLAEFELDLFGRVRSLGDAALQRYL